MSRSIPIVVFVLATASCAVLAADRDAVSEYAWLHVTGEAAGPSGLAPADLEVGEDAHARFLEAEHPYVDLLERHALRLSRDGTITTRTVVARHFLTAEGVRNHGDLSVTVRAGIEELYLVHASVRMPDGTTRPMDLHRAQVTTDARPSVFSDVYYVVLPFEGLVPGATAILEVRSVRDADRWPLPWSVTFSPQRLAPIGRLEIELTWEPGVKPPIWSTDSELVDCRSEGNRLQCRARDVPALVLDHESPNILEEFPQLVFSERRSWTELALAEAGLVARSTRESGELEPLLRRLLDGAETRVERLRRLHHFVADEIRYVSLSHGASAVAPAAVARTLDRRYGDCKDKVATFLALAHGAGFRAHPVLIATLRSSPEKLITPSLLYFDHMIACVDGAAPEERTCIDLTATHMRTGDLPPGLYGTVALDLTDEAVGPRRVEAPPIVWEIEIEATNRLACDGKLTEEMSRSFLGSGAGQVRAALLSFSPDDRERWMIDDYRTVMGQEIELEASAAGLDSAVDALTLQTTTEFEVDSIDEIEAYNEQDSWLLHYAGWFETENERRPYTLQGARIQSRLTYQICPEKRVRFTGAGLNLVGPFGALRRSYTKQTDGVEVKTELTLPSATIPAEDLDRYRRFLGRALAQTWIWFNLEPRRSAIRRTE